MITLYNKTTIPQGGFSYFSAGPVGNPDATFTIASVPYDRALELLMAYRSANPWLNLPTDAASCSHELIYFTYARLKAVLGLKYTLQFFTAESEDDPEIAEREAAVKVKLAAESAARAAGGGGCCGS